MLTLAPSEIVSVLPAPKTPIPKADCEIHDDPEPVTWTELFEELAAEESDKVENEKDM